MININNTPKVHFDVGKNKKETKYLTPEGKEVDRVSTHKVILGDTWSKYQIGVYKGREMTYNMLQSNNNLLDSYEELKKFFNEENKKNKEQALNKGSQYHKDIEECILASVKEEYKEQEITDYTDKIDYEVLKEHLVMLLNIPYIDDTGETTYICNPFAQMLLDDIKEGWRILFVEKSFTYEDDESAQGGTIDLVLYKIENNVSCFKIKDWKTSGKSKEERYDENYIEYGMQLAVYQKALISAIEQELIITEKHTIYSTIEICWEDGEITNYPQNILDSLYQQFVAGFQYKKILEENTKLIKKLRSEE